MKKLALFFLIVTVSLGLSAAKIHKVGVHPKVVTVADNRYTISEFENSSTSEAVGRTAAVTSIADAVTLLDGHGGIIQVENETAVDADLTVPSNVMLILPPTAVFRVASTKTLTLNCQVQGVVTNTGAGSVAYGSSYSSPTSFPGPVQEYYVDGGRTDSYTADGSITRPYSTIALAATAINADSVVQAAAGDYLKTNYVINVAAGTYSGNLTFNNQKCVKIYGNGVTISGTIALTQTQQGGDYYSRIEFVGAEGTRTEKGPAFKLAGAITCTRNNDSLTYVAFKGCWISGNTVATGDGTWVMHYENCRVAGTIDTGTFADADSAILIETTGWNEFAGAITDKVSFYNADNVEFWGAINTTPIFESRFTNCRFGSTVAINAQTIYMDLVSYKAMLARTPTLAGATVSILETYGAGTKAATGNSVVDTNSGSLHTSTFTLTNVALTLTAAGAGVGFGNVKLYDFPQGYIYFIGAVSDLTITSADADLADAWEGDISLGTTADADGSLAGTEVNIIPKTATPAATAKATTGDAVSTATEHAIVDGTTAFDLYINLLVDAANIADASDAPVAISGTITITWINLGDN